jgi:hypothetical protein
LFGGLEITGPSAAIFMASTSSPTVWTNVGTLPIPVYGSAFGQIDGYFWKFGGMLSSNDPTFYVWSASVNNPLDWSLIEDGYLPYSMAFGQFFTVGDFGYLVGPMTTRSEIMYGPPLPTLANTGFTPIVQASLGATPLMFQDTEQIIRGVLSHSQMAFVYDRIWFFGGSGETAIFACNQRLKFSVNDEGAIAYGNISRVALQSYTMNLANPLQILCFPYWLTDYQL